MRLFPASYRDITNTHLSEPIHFQNRIQKLNTDEAVDSIFKTTPNYLKKELLLLCILVVKMGR